MMDCPAHCLKMEEVHFVFCLADPEVGFTAFSSRAFLFFLFAGVSLQGHEETWKGPIKAEQIDQVSGFTTLFDFTAPTAAIMSWQSS